MKNRKWFALVNGKVEGPFDIEDLQGRLPSWQNSLIWGQGQSEWLTPKKWESLLQMKSSSQQTSPEPTRQWTVREEDEELAPMTYSQMIHHLKSNADLSKVLIWTEGYSEWKDVYQVHKIMDELGVSRRKHPRVPIMGTINFEGSGNFSAKLLSLSEGGLGVTDVAKVKIGEKFKLIIKSSKLSSTINATGEVVYTDTDGYAGIRFIGLQADSKNQISEYIKNFFETQSL